MQIRSYLIPAACLIVFLFGNTAKAELNIIVQQDITNNASVHDPEEKLLEQGKFDATYYGLDLKLDIDNRTLYGNTTVKGKSVVENLGVIVLDFYNNFKVKNVTGDAENFTHSSNVLTIKLKKALKKREQFIVHIEYSGSPMEVGMKSFSFRVRNGNPLVTTLSEPYYARAWYPCKDIPGDKANTVDINITVPDTLTATSNGLLKKVVDNKDGTKTFYWHESYPIATYLVSIAVSKYEAFSHWYKYSPTDSMEVQYYVFPDYMDRQNPGIDYCVEMIKVFSDIYGQYPFIKEKYAMSQFSWGGAMEHQTNSSMTSFGENVTAHELAHQWWGDMVTCVDWRNSWINEGFATYSEAIWYEKKYGKQRYKDHVASFSSRGYSGSIYRRDINSSGVILDRIVYSKAAFVLHMLRDLIGDDKFFKVLKEFRRNHLYGNASTKDFQKVCEKYYGKDMEWFFNQWIMNSGRPRYEYGWKHIKGGTDFGDDYLYFRIKQTQTSGPVFRMPLTVRIKHDGGYIDKVIMNETRDELLKIPINVLPTEVEIDPENVVLKYTNKVEFDTTEVSVDHFSIKQNYPNPFYSLKRISLNLPESRNISLGIYNILGEKVKNLYNDYMSAGTYDFRWDCKDESGNELPEGMYLCRLETDDLTITRKILYLKR
ncbi:M1 family aminopeptidase [candidate division KSB1 bacterium]